jgi:hypothetical protein
MSVDVSMTIAPRTDQLNSDCLLAGPITIRITKVQSTGSKDQPISIYYDGDDGKPYKPCLSMRRVLVTLWGKDGASYVGRWLTLYRDARVRFGGEEVGGIRISHASDINKPVTMPLTVTRGSRKPYTVEPLKLEPEKSRKAAKSLDERVAAFLAMLQGCATVEAVNELCDSERAVKLREEVSAQVRTDILLAREKRVAEITKKKE